MNQVEELRHAGKHRDAALAERPEQFRRVDRFQKYDAGANRQRQQQVGHLRQGVKQRQHAEDAVMLGDRDRFEHRRALGNQVRVRQDDALRVARRAGGVKRDGRVRQRCRAGRHRRCRQASACHGLEADAGLVLAVEHDDAQVGGGGAGLEHHGEKSGAGEHDSCAGVSQQRFDLGRLVGRVQRHGDRAAAKDAQVGGTPVRVIVRKDRAAIAGRDADQRQPGGRALGHLAKLGIGQLVQAVATLNFNGDPVGVLIDRSGKQLVEVLRHAPDARMITDRISRLWRA